MIFRKSQVFMFDMILSIVILILAISLAFNYYVSGNTEIDIYNLNKNILDGFTNSKVSSLNDEEIRMMYASNKIYNIENTVAQQVIEFHESITNKRYAKDLTRIFIEDYIDNQMNFNITIENDTQVIDVLYNITNRPSISFENASISAVTQRRIFAYKNTSDFYGPYLIKIKIWK